MHPLYYPGSHHERASRSTIARLPGPLCRESTRASSVRGPSSATLPVSPRSIRVVILVRTTSHLDPCGRLSLVDARVVHERIAETGVRPPEARPVNGERRNLCPMGRACPHRPSGVCLRTGAVGVFDVRKQGDAEGRQLHRQRGWKQSASIAERGGSQMVEHRARPSGETGRKRLQERADAGERRAGVLESLCAAGSTVNRRSAGQLPGILGQQCKQVEWCAGAICGASIAVVRQ